MFHCQLSSIDVDFLAQMWWIVADWASAHVCDVISGAAILDDVTSGAAILDDVISGSAGTGSCTFPPFFVSGVFPAIFSRGFSEVHPFGLFRVSFT